MTENTEQLDVLVVGGGAAGLSAGVTLSRARRRVLVVDQGNPRNAPAGHVHNYLGNEGVPPLELLRRGRAELASYGGSVRESGVVDVHGARGDFTATLDDGSTVRARRLVVTTGLVDRLPDIEGVAERWGIRCPALPVLPRLGGSRPGHRGAGRSRSCPPTRPSCSASSARTSPSSGRGSR